MWHVGAGEFTKIYDQSVGESEPWYLNDHTVFADSDGLWHMIGITHAEPASAHVEIHLAHATAPALSGPWEKQAFALTADPALGETVLWAPHVVVHDGRYWMFVCAGAVDRTAFRIILATSTDAVTWTRHAANPLVVDGYEARDPMVLRVGERWVMYYTATEAPDWGHYIVAAVESDDLLHWGERRVVYVDETIGNFGGPTESPFVIERDGRYHLLIGPDWAGMLAGIQRDGTFDPATYRRTHVFASDDPFHFEAADQVGLIEAHAAEVVVDEAGRSWVTHCGWGQGGLHLARLERFDL